MVSCVDAKTIKWSLAILSLVVLVSSLMFFPLLRAEAASVLLETAEKRVQQDKPYISNSIDTTSYSDLTFSFSYDATTLDGFATSTGQDQFSYGWQAGSDRHIVGTVIGLAGSTTAEHGLINVVLPESASVVNLELFIEVSANSTSTSDKVELRNIILTGNLKENVEPEPEPEPNPEPAIDVCLNIEGTQTEIPAGYESSSAGVCTEIVVENPSPEPEPVTDVCQNLEGIQTAVPEGYVKDEQNQCVPIPPPVVDVCSNIEGNQSELPKNYQKDSSGLCVPIVVGSPNPEPQICPKGYARWVDKFDGGNIWRADDVYKSVILVGKNENYRRNFNLNRHIYIPGPTEVGDRYYHRFHKISHVCVK